MPGPYQTLRQSTPVLSNSGRDRDPPGHGPLRPLPCKAEVQLIAIMPVPLMIATRHAMTPGLSTVGL